MSMTAETLKMKAVIGLIFSALLMSGKMVIVESAVYSSAETAVKFSQCLIDEMSETQFFTSEDRDSMIEVQDVLEQGLISKGKSFSVKVVVIAFITSLADIIILDDDARSDYRKEVYSSALEKCLVSSTGYTDAEFLNEALRILSVFENNKVKKYEGMSAGISAAETFGSVSYHPVSGMGSPFAVQPSPVQNPSAPRYFDSNDKTVFEQQEKAFSSLQASSAVNSQYDTRPLGQMSLSPSFDIGLETQPGNSLQRFDYPSASRTGGFVSGLQYEAFPIGSEASGMLQPEKGFVDLPGKFLFNSDAGKMSEINDDRSDVSSYSESLQIGPINKNDISQTSFGGLSIPQTKESSVIVIPPKTNQQFVSNEHSFQNTQHGTKEEIYLPKSQESAPKTEESDFSMSPPIVIPQTQQQYSDVTSYLEIENDAFNTLTNSPKFRKAFNSEISQGNAINLARAITEQTFAGYGLNILNDALSVITEEVTKVRVPSPETFAFALSKALVSILKLHDTILSAERSQLASNFLSSLDDSGQFYSQQSNTKDHFQDSYPGETTYSEFAEIQTDFDFQSPPLSPEDRKDEMFSLSLAQYLSNSEVIRNFFCGESEAVDKVQIFFSVIKSSLTEYGIHVATLAASVASGSLSELSEEELCHNYAKTLSEIVAEIFEEKGIDDANAESISSKMELNLNQRQITPTESQKYSTAPNSFIQRIPESETYATEPNLEPYFTSVEEINPQYQTKTEHPDLDDDSDYKYAHTSTSISTAEPTIDSDSYEWAPDGIIDQEALANYLVDKFEYALASYNSRGNEPEDSNDEENFATTEIAKQYENRDYESSKEEFSEESHTKSENEKQLPTLQSDTLTTYSDQSEDEEDDSKPIAESEDKFSYHQDKNEFRQEDIVQSDPMESKVKTSPVELQPSFQDPVRNSEDSSTTFQPKFDDLSHDSEYSNLKEALARQISETAESSRAYIHSQNFDRSNLCAQINQLAPIVNIPPLENCKNFAAIDYLLTVLIAAVRILRGN